MISISAADMRQHYLSVSTPRVTLCAAADAARYRAIFVSAVGDAGMLAFDISPRTRGYRRYARGYLRLRRRPRWPTSAARHDDVVIRMAKAPRPFEFGRRMPRHYDSSL